MSHPVPHNDQQASAEAQEDFILKPRPRQHFELSSNPPSEPTTPKLDAQSTSPFPDFEPNSPTTIENTIANAHMEDSSTTTATTIQGSRTPARTKSFAELTRSSLAGIYQPNSEANTPWGTGAQTPALGRMSSYDFGRMNLPESALFRKGTDGNFWRQDPTPRMRKPQPTGFNGYWVPLIKRTIILFVVGALYGVLVSHLYEKQKLAPVAVNIDRDGWTYYALWGCVAAVLGNALPYADSFWESNDDYSAYLRKLNAERQGKNEDGLGAWMDAARLIGAFVGVAFAIRKLPWQSTLQLSLTLALANPAVWYLVDRSPPGFILSGVVAFSGTAMLLGFDPELVPAPSPWQVVQARIGGANQTVNLPKPEELVLGLFSEELVGVATWVASVLFVSCVCFGNIGRRLAPGKF